MGHSITISDDNLYNQISNYCKENGLKLNIFCTNLLKSAFRTEQYGNIPFGEIKRKEEQNDIPLEILNHIQKRVENIQNEKNMIVETVEQNIMAQEKEKNDILQNDVNDLKEQENNQEIKPKKRRL